LVGVERPLFVAQDEQDIRLTLECVPLSPLVSGLLEELARTLVVLDRFLAVP